MRKVRGGKKVTSCWEWRRNCQKEPKICAVSKRRQDLKYLHFLPLGSSRYFRTFFNTNEKILMGKYKRRKDNVIWGKEDGCPPSSLPRILFPFSTPATPFLFSAHWRRKYDWIVGLHHYRAASCQVSAQTLTEFCFTQTAVVWSRVICDIVNFCMPFCDIDGNFRSPWQKRKQHKWCFIWQTGK